MLALGAGEDEFWFVDREPELPPAWVESEQAGPTPLAQMSAAGLNATRYATAAVAATLSATDGRASCAFGAGSPT